MPKKAKTPFINDMVIYHVTGSRWDYDCTTYRTYIAPKGEEANIRKIFFDDTGEKVKSIEILQTQLHQGVFLVTAISPIGTILPYRY